ncbi:MAG TPA: LCP family protein, partial [Streptosporangiaceae bacterium]|nr:LCP family protein [Streptosporangiaceae bacterium]
MRRGTAHPRGAWAGASGLGKAGYLGTAFVTVAVMVLSLAADVIYTNLEGNIHSVTVNGLTQRSVAGVQNILVLGSQTRMGQRGHFGPDLFTNNSDNLLLVHLDATHTHATVLSIPRDTMVYEPGCRAVPRVGRGIWGPYPSAIIDGAMNIGGPSCAVATVEDLTGIRLDHFVEFDFNSFRTMVDAIGGVEVCVPPGGYRDPWSRLRLSGGRHLLTYNQALAYVRTRHGVGDGGDLGRIELQQAFISSVIQKVNNQGILNNSVGLLRIADTATKALTVDQGLDSVDSLLALARSLTGLHARNVTLLTMPTMLDPADPNRLVPQQPEDDLLFQMLRTGKLWRHHLSTLPAGKVSVRVLNGTGTAGLAGHTAT